MIFLLFVVPFLIVLFSVLVLTNAGRNNKEKLTVFFYTPEDAGSGSSKLIAVLRIVFWISLILCAWIIIGIVRHRV